MRLIQCYIENFGGLSQYQCAFEPGLTAIQTPNGSGKTTLAEFIRAMFYGFPRANKALEKNRRKKYRPWQGGRYGGSLTFSHEGATYRIERFFGAVPAADTFALYDVTAHTRSDRFSPELGAELFQLDADSFERSTYLPQLHDSLPLATDSIQAKLGDLVDDANDVNNYEKAVKALQSKRSSLLPYRGQGGAVGQAQRKISELDTALAASRASRPRLDALRQQLEQARRRQRDSEAARDAVLDNMRLASEAAGRATVSQRLAQMEAAYAELRRTRDALQGNYPHGLPPMAELESVLRLYDELAPLTAPPSGAPAYGSAKQQLLQSGDRFANGVPGEDEFSAIQDKCQDYARKSALLEGCRLPQEELEKWEELTRFFAPGPVDDAFLSQCRERQQSLRGLQAELSGQSLSPAEQSRLDELEAFFGCPSDGELAEQRESLRKIQRLREENAAALSRPAPAQKKGKVFLPVLLLALAAVIAGAVLLALQSFPAGGALLGLGALLSALAVYLRLRDMVAPSAPAPGAAAANEAELARLEQSLRRFLAQYALDGDSLPERFSQLEAKRRELLFLRDADAARREKREALLRRIEQCRAWLDGRLSPYFGETLPDDPCAVLQWNDREYRALEERRRRSLEESARLREDLDGIEGGIRAFLEPYTGPLEPREFPAALDALRRECAGYRQDQALVSAYESELAAREERLSAYREQLRGFSRTYGLALDLDSRQTAQALRDDAATFLRVSGELGRLEGDIALFTEQNRAILDAPAPGEGYDLDSLRREKGELDARLSALASDIAGLEQDIRTLQAEADRAPQLEDELAYWTGVFAEGRETAGLLDETVEFLRRAKEQLSTSYLGTIQGSFSSLLRRLTGEEEAVSVGTQLDVQLERGGARRELAYFSAGQSDLVLLCMRLALADALFPEVKPFLILDDPFVNLDDRHTEQALALLRDLAADYQIIYLTCSSSRAPEGARQ